MQTFNELELRPEILDAISEMGFKNPTPVQAKAIPEIITNNNDVIALAQTGTGKTAAFGLPILQMIETEKKLVQALILCPTRELCMQIAKDLTNFSTKMKGLKVIAVYGGASVQPQLKELKSGCQIVVGTPGRTLDFVKRKALNISKINWLVLDEADEMLNMGFQEDLDDILATSNPNKSTFLFSATMPKEIVSITKKYMNNPVEISCGSRNSGTENVIHHYYMANSRDRFEALKRIVDLNPDIYGIIFCRTRSETKEVASKLMDSGYNADTLHGDLSQAQRDYVMDRFRVKHLQLLVATDVAARGLDVNDLTHVINYNLPDDPEVYVHRSGRTGRAGKKGVCMSIINSREARKVKDIEKLTKRPFEKKQVPSGKEVCEKQLFHLIDNITNSDIDHSQIEPYLEDIFSKLDGISKEDLIKHIFSKEFKRLLDYYQASKDITFQGNDKGDRDPRRGRDRNERDRREKAPFSGNRQSGKEFINFHINLGSKVGLNTGKLISLLNEQTNDRSMEIGKVDVMRNFSFFEIEKGYDIKIDKAFNDFEYDGEKVIVKKAKNQGEAKPGNPWDGMHKGKKDKKKKKTSKQRKNPKRSY